MLLNLLLLLLLPVLLTTMSVILPAAGHPCPCMGPRAPPAWCPHCRACPWSVPFPPLPAPSSSSACAQAPHRGCHSSMPRGVTSATDAAGIIGGSCRNRPGQWPGQGSPVRADGCCGPATPTGDGVACACSEGVCQQPGDFSQRAQQLFYCLTALFSSSWERSLSFNPLRERVAEAILEAGGSSFEATRHLMGADISASDTISAAALPLPAES